MVKTFLNGVSCFFLIFTVFNPCQAEGLKPADIDPEILEFLYLSASIISGYRELEPSSRPNIYVASKKNLYQLVCPTDPENCPLLAAVYDDEKNRIIYIDDLDMDDDQDNSFLLHEIVHALQYTNGTLKYDTHEDLCYTEGEAYRVQNIYLKNRSVFFRSGERLRMMGCPDDLDLGPL